MGKEYMQESATEMSENSYGFYANHKKNRHTIEVSDDIRAILKNIHYNSFCIFDLDDTIFEPYGPLGSTPWSEWLIEHCMIFTNDKSKALRLSELLDDAIQQHIHMKPVEETTVIIIKTLQAIGIPAIGLTARSPSIQNLTINQLQAIDINFRGETLSFTPKRDTNTSFYQGVLFCGDENKGECLKLLSGLPRHLVFVDDRRRNIEHVTQVCGKNHAISGLHYTHLSNKRDFCLVKALSELESILNLLPD